MSSVPPGFDWVEERFACSSVEVFKQLEIDVKKDAARMNELRGPDALYKFSVTGTTSGDMFMVYEERIDPYGIKREVKFHAGDAITIVGLDGKSLKAALTLNNEGQGRLKINDEEYEQWQVRKMVLEPLFFG